MQLTLKRIDNLVQGQHTILVCKNLNDSIFNRACNMNFIKHIKLQNNTDKQTTQKSSCNGTEASVLRGRALSLQGYTALS